MTHRTWYRRRSFYGALLVALIAAAIPVSQTLASPSPSTVTVPIEKNNTDNCVYGAKKTIGKATFIRNKDGSLTVRYSLHGAAPTRTYNLRLFSDSPTDCFQVVAGDVGKFKVDASGDGSTTFVVQATDVSGYSDFWVLGDNIDANSQDRTDVAHV
jgi:hypothetical protein